MAWMPLPTMTATGLIKLLQGKAAITRLWLVDISNALVCSYLAAPLIESWEAKVWAVELARHLILRVEIIGN